MTGKVRHVLGISGGKDSAALAIHLRKKYPKLDIEYYCCDTGKELDETYKLIKNLEVYLGKKIEILESAKNSHEDPFDHFLKLYGGYLPSSNSRWCTRKLKLEPFEKWVGDDPVISYVGIRGDEDREGYISTKQNIQSIFPFRQNIWSEDVISKVLRNDNIEFLSTQYAQISDQKIAKKALNIIYEPLSKKFTQTDKLHALINLDVIQFNQAVFIFLKNTKYPISQLEEFPLITDDEILVRDDIFNLLRNSGVGVPKYYEKVGFDVDNQHGHYARSRSGCYFCFFQQKIEWVWLYEQHPDLFKKAMDYEKDGYTWMQDEKLEDLIKPERLNGIKRDQIQKAGKEKNKKSQYLLDILDDAEGEGCAACFI
jgi:3'-phosphoadenosine 5'-phosphosulfate sulfotransferase (PAPS reductase)/FAD synthetase